MKSERVCVSMLSAGADRLPTGGAARAGEPEEGPGEAHQDAGVRLEAGEVRLLSDWWKNWSSDWWRAGPKANYRFKINFKLNVSPSLTVSSEPSQFLEDVVGIRGKEPEWFSSDWSQTSQFVYK